MLKYYVELFHIFSLRTLTCLFPLFSSVAAQADEMLLGSFGSVPPSGPTFGRDETETDVNLIDKGDFVLQAATLVHHTNSPSTRSNQPTTAPPNGSFPLLLLPTRDSVSGATWKSQQEPSTAPGVVGLPLNI